MSAAYRDGELVSVLVVGGGPTGVAAATMLAQRDVDVLVIDRWPDIYPLPRAVHLDDEIHRILQGIGAAEAFTAISEPRQGLRVVDSRLRPMAQFDRTRRVGDHGWPQANFFDQPDLERVLRDTLAGTPRARLCGRTQLVSFTQNMADGPAPIRAVIQDMETGDRATIWTHAVLGCDGANSTVRDLIGASLLDLGFEERWLVVDVLSPQTLDVWDGVYQVSDTRRPATFMQVGPGRYRWEFRLDDSESIDDLIAPDRLAELIRPWTQDVAFDSLHVVRKAEYTFRARITDRWQDGRVFLLGDAAHLTPPFIGQGLCAALRDASNLTWKLAAVLNDRAPEQLLATYQAERDQPARALINKAVRLGVVMTGGPNAMGHVRRVALAALCRIPGATTKVLDSPPPPLPVGPLVQRSRRSPLPGTLVPQPWVELAGERVRLDSVLGSGFAILTSAAPGPGLREIARQLAAPVIVVTPVPVPQGVGTETDIIACDIDDTVLPWLAGAGAGAAVIRPDRVVQAQTTERDRDLDPADLGIALAAGVPEPIGT